MEDLKMTRCEDLKNIADCSFEEYLEMPGLNFHRLQNFMKNPKLESEGWYEKDRVVTDEMRFGTQFHELVLQGRDLFEANNALWEPPVNAKTGEAYGSGTKAYKEAAAEWDELNVGKRRYSAEEMTRFEKMIESLRKNKLSNILLFESGAEYRSEMAFAGVWDELLLKGSIDRYDERFGIIDLKTTSCLVDKTGYRKFQYRTVPDYGYLEQLAFYQIGMRKVCGAEDYPETAIVAVETVEPFQVGVVFPVYSGSDGAREEVYRWLRFYKECAESGEWVDPMAEPIYLNTYRPSSRYVGNC